MSLLQDLPESPKRDEWELETLIALGPVLMNMKGSASREVREAYVRARDLCVRAGEPAQQFPVLWGLWLHHYMAGESKTALRLAHEAIELAERLSNEDFLLQAHHAAWSSQVALANYAAVVTHADQGLAYYDVERHRSHAFTYGGHDPGICAALDSAIAIWFLSYPDQANKRSERALELAPVVAHTFSTAQTLAYVAQLRLLRREPEQAIQLLDELIPFSEEHGLTLWRANGKVLRSWAVSDMGRASQVLDEFREGIRQRRAAGSRMRLSLHLAAMAHALARAGEASEAKTVIGQALDQMDKTGERTWEAFIHWIKGQILASFPEAGLGRAAACYKEAFEIAKRQRANSMELRGATSLARVWVKENRKDEARNLLAPIYNWFSEGFDTPDLKDAKMLLDELS